MRYVPNSSERVEQLRIAYMLEECKLEHIPEGSHGPLRLKQEQASGIESPLDYLDPPTEEERYPISLDEYMTP